MMQKILLAVPTYGPVDPYASRSLRAAIMTACKHGLEFYGDISPDRNSWTVARNQIAAAACEIGDEASGVMWVDSDVILPPHAIVQLAARDLDFVTGVYYQRNPPHYPLIANFDEKRKSFQWLVKWPESVVAPVDGCGFGCVFTSTKLLKDIGQDWFTYRQYSEDFDFCLKARERGYTLYADTQVQCGHLADPVPITGLDFRRTHPELFAVDRQEDSNGVH